LGEIVHSRIVVRVGDTVEWTNQDPGESHTVTFFPPGTEPPDPRKPSTDVNGASDGAEQATISSTTDMVNSGLLAFVNQDRPMLPETPLGVTRFRVTFIAAGTYKYFCSLHDNLGMVGTVIVH
jgi:plastocyanin